MKRSLLSFLAVFIFLISSAMKAEAAKGTNERIQGADRFEVAVNISKAGWTNGPYC